MVKTIVAAFMALALMIMAGCGTGPDAPQNLTVTSTSPITLTWTAVSGATSYNVYRGTVAGGGLSNKTILAQNVTATTYQDNATTSGTTYYYQVTAVNSDGASAASNEVNAVAQQSGNTFVLGGQKNGSQIDLTWSNFAGAVSYKVYRGTISSTVSGKTLIQSGITGLTFSDTGPTVGVTNFYQVQAINAAGTPIADSTEASVAF
jgi:cellulose 1,4-beta-cellobiosidase